jgi:predicted lysophospholipase L1 biosynthesis ABC-type transport system permease subunit
MPSMGAWLISTFGRWPITTQVDCWTSEQKPVMERRSPKVQAVTPGLVPNRCRAWAGVMNAFAARAARLGPFAVQGPATPTDVVNFGRVQSLPLLLGMALSLLALVTIVHLLLTSVRRRRRDLAVLRSIGLTRQQVRSAVGWQAGTLTAVALGLGIPAGIVCGRVAWRLFAGQLGIEPVVVLPVILLLVVPAALVLAVAVAAVPGESAARTRPAEILRSE